MGIFLSFMSSLTFDLRCEPLQLQPMGNRSCLLTAFCNKGIIVVAKQWLQSIGIMHVMNTNNTIIQYVYMQDWNVIVLAKAD